MRRGGTAQADSGRVEGLRLGDLRLLLKDSAGGTRRPDRASRVLVAGYRRHRQPADLVAVRPVALQEDRFAGCDALREDGPMTRRAPQGDGVVRLPDGPAARDVLRVRRHAANCFKVFNESSNAESSASDRTVYVRPSQVTFIEYMAGQYAETGPDGKSGFMGAIFIFRSGPFAILVQWCDFLNGSAVTSLLLRLDLMGRICP